MHWEKCEEQENKILTGFRLLAYLQFQSLHIHSEIFILQEGPFPKNQDCVELRKKCEQTSEQKLGVKDLLNIKKPQSQMGSCSQKSQT